MTARGCGVLHTAAGIPGILKAGRLRPPKTQVATAAHDRERRPGCPGPQARRLDRCHAGCAFAAETSSLGTRTLVRHGLSTVIARTAARMFAPAAMIKTVSQPPVAFWIAF